jgi:hypothetical protein
MLVKAGTSPVRTGVRLKRTASSVQIKARELGIPFQDLRVVKRKQRQRERDLRKELGLNEVHNGSRTP